MPAGRAPTHEPGAGNLAESIMELTSAEAADHDVNFMIGAGRAAFQRT
jgi:hypothetical protein